MMVLLISRRKKEVDKRKVFGYLEIENWFEKEDLPYYSKSHTRTII